MNEDYGEKELQEVEIPEYMSKEYVLQLLKTACRNTSDKEELKAAVYMAIKALENEGCGCGLCLAHNNMKCPKMPLTNKKAMR